MKITFVFIALYLSQAHASFSPCDSFSCSIPQQKINVQYEQALPISADITPKVYSGSCFHTAFGFDSRDTHYAVILLDRKKSTTYFYGRFSMFNKTDPYSNLTLEQAREYLSVDYSPKHVLTLSSIEGFIDFNPERLPIWQYHVRTNNNESKLFLFGLWGFSHSFLCELEQRQNS